MQTSEDKTKSLLKLVNTPLLFLLIVMGLFIPGFSEANNENFDGVNCSDLPKNSVDEYKRKKECFKYQRELKAKANNNKFTKYKEVVLDTGVSHFTKTPLKPLSENQKLMYPYRTIGSLEITFSVKQDNGSYRDIVGHCTAYLTGKNELKTAAHCYDSEKFVGTVKKAAVVFNSKLNIKKHRFDVNLDSIVNGYDDDKNPESWDWASFNIDEPIGDILGFWSIDDGGSRGFKTGNKGSLPQPIGVKEPCKAKHSNVNDWENPVNQILAFNDDVLDKRPYSSFVIDASLVEEDEFQVCSVGFTNHQNYELSISNCGLGGVADGKILNNCSFIPGMSGGPGFYYNQNYDDHIAFGQNSFVRPPSESPEEYGYFNHNHTNTISFTGSGIPDFYDTNRGKYVASVQNLLNGGLAQKEQPTRGRGTSTSR